MAFSQACSKNTWRKQLQGGRIVLIHILGRDATVASCASGSREGMLVLDSLYFIFTPDLKAVEWCHSPHNSCESFCFSYPQSRNSLKDLLCLLGYCRASWDMSVWERMATQYCSSARGHCALCTGHTSDCSKVKQSVGESAYHVLDLTAWNPAIMLSNCDCQ